MSNPRDACCMFNLAAGNVKLRRQSCISVLGAGEAWEVSVNRGVYTRIVDRHAEAIFLAAGQRMPAPLNAGEPAAKDVRMPDVYVMQQELQTLKGQMAKIMEKLGLAEPVLWDFNSIPAGRLPFKPGDVLRCKTSALSGKLRDAGSGNHIVSLPGDFVDFWLTEVTPFQFRGKICGNLCEIDTDEVRIADLKAFRLYEKPPPDHVSFYVKRQPCDCKMNPWPESKDV